MIIDNHLDIISSAFWAHQARHKKECNLIFLSSLNLQIQYSPVCHLTTLKNCNKDKPKTIPSCKFCSRDKTNLLLLLKRGGRETSLLGLGGRRPTRSSLIMWSSKHDTGRLGLRWHCEQPVNPSSGAKAGIPFFMCSPKDIPPHTSCQMQKQELYCPYAYSSDQ